jgi:hypothetical protein
VVPGLDVNIVANNATTIASLRIYLTNAGILTHEFDALPATIASGTTAVVVFPDELDPDGVVPWIEATARPDLLMVLITGSPQRFRTTGAVVLPKPAFGWAILDAIRAHADGTQT